MTAVWSVLLAFLCFVTGAFVALLAARQFSKPPTDPLPAVMEMFRTMYGDRTTDQANDAKLIAAQTELNQLLTLPEPAQEQWIDPTAGFQPEHQPMRWITPGEDPFEGLRGEVLDDEYPAT